MQDQLNVTDVTQEEDVKELSYFNMPNGSRVYIANYPGARDDAVEHAKESGLISFYILATYIPKLKIANTNNYKDGEPQPTLFKVIDNVVGTSFTKVSSGDMGLETVADTVYFKLPKIPWEMVEKIDAFFRKVNKDLGGSEAIIILGFDTRCDDGSGWRIIVPDQNNNAGHCRYEPQSVIDMIPDEDFEHVMQVGTCHSHPGMSAFASHTDENDQSHFDGIHITFGWRGPTTEYHIEIQANGVGYEAIPEYVFDIPEQLKKEYPEFDEWMSHVHKQTLVQNSPVVINKRKTELRNLSPGAPNPDEFTVVAEIVPNPSVCPVCTTKLTETEIDQRRCIECQSFFIYVGESLSDLVRIREAMPKPVYEIKRGINPRAITVWHPISAQANEVISSSRTAPGKALPPARGFL